MSTNLRNGDELLDDDPTDELPVLLEAADVVDDCAEATGELAGLNRESAPASEGGRGSRLAALQRELDTLAQRLQAAERELHDKSAAIAALDAALADARRALAAAEGTAAELRDTVAARDTELDGLHAEIAAVRGERDTARAALAAVPTLDQRLQLAQDEAAALATYIANRRAHWDALEARCARHERRIAELELEVEQRRKRQRAAEESAANEMAQASAWRAELAAALNGAGTSAASATDTAGAARAAPAEPQARAPDPSLERLRRELTEAYAKLAQTSSDIARLERKLADRNRALAARDERIGQLERELAVRFAPPPAAPTEVAVAEATHGGGATRKPRPDAGQPRAAELVAVNDAAKRRYSIGKPVLTIGRSSRCDIQVLTQFVSREHARLVVDSGEVFVEDSGSTNGVFVNAARIERQRLEHGDLLTIGETQFRFQETTTP